MRHKLNGNGAETKTHQQVLEENDALKAEIVKLKHQLEDCQQIRKEQTSYIRGLWEDNQKVHAELRSYNRQEEQTRRRLV